MPELPEVETIRRGLEGFLVGKKAGRILKVRVYEAKSFIGKEEDVVGARVESLYRRGKALIIHLTNKNSLLIHLRMTGQLIWRNKNSYGDILKSSFAGGHPNENFVAELPNKQTRVEIEFEEGKLFFND